MALRRVLRRDETEKYMRSSGESWARGKGRRLSALFAALAIVAAACGSAEETTSESEAEASLVEEATTTTTEAEQEPEPDEALEDEGAGDDEVVEEEEAPVEEAAAEPLLLTSLGTSVELDFGIPVDAFESPGFAGIGRMGELAPVGASQVLMARPNGFATLEQRNAEFPLPLFTGALDEWFAHPEVNVMNTSESTVGGLDATVTEFVIERSDDAVQDCGPPPEDQCIFVFTTPDPAQATNIRLRTGEPITMWEIDQGDNDPLVAIVITIAGDDEWPSLARAAIETAVIGDPAPAPEGLASFREAGEHSFDSLGGITMTIPEDTIAIEGTLCVLLQFDTNGFETGMLFGRIDQDIDGALVSDEQVYFDSFGGQVSREETGRTIDLFDTTLTEFAVEETGQNMSVSSCAPEGEDVFSDVLVGFIGAGTEYVADAEDGGIYLVGWTTINPDAAAERSAQFDQILESLEIAGG